MSDELNNIKRKLSDVDFWLRFILVIVFCGLLFFIVIPLTFILVFTQVLFVLIGGEVNRNLRLFSQTLSDYAGQILSFATYNSETKPFPFSDFPAAADFEYADMGEDKDEEMGEADGGRDAQFSEEEVLSGVSAMDSASPDEDDDQASRKQDDVADVNLSHGQLSDADELSPQEANDNESRNVEAKEIEPEEIEAKRVDSTDEGSSKPFNHQDSE
ncbi:MAG: hypothetical protein COC19_06895 [SAR86 cluster bacterium]|uniref:DUF4389 domain-containing protein n=1 Tax=SAR86 cluster bacterium TaxID=2030880 RepID=A0A2A4MIM3_9GAMM|nr:MAG: hypothetical protein COC19_06895 [SAR86 cluster bacterium]